MECVTPTDRLDVLNVATPLLLSVAEPSVVLLTSLNVTVPVGVIVTGLTTLTKAMNITLWPNTDELLGLTCSVTLLLAGLTGWLKEAVVLAAKMLVPA